ncbi:MAG: imidazolonepropionase [Gemmatimonadetes bacterium]|nr:imidazolonepropionase [Gemmatimonadota bacterium]
MPVLRNIAILYQCRAAGGQAEVHPVPNAALAWEDGTVAWVGPEAALPPAYRDWPVEDARGQMVIPGLVDCHTHLAFAGWRAEEFAEKLAGASYLDIARRGGGILSTVVKTRAATAAELATRCLGFLDRMQALGVTTVEAKTGYGLDLATEIRLLQVYRTVASRWPGRVVPTLLAAHTVPPEFRDDPDGYVGLVVDRIIPAAAEGGLARFCDVFVEDTAFTVEQATRILLAGRRHGLVPKLHADQITAGGGAELAARVGAASADHLEKVSQEGIAAMAAAGVVAVTLPIASLYLNVAPTKARDLIAAGVPVAVATDFNPGSAPSYDLHLAMMLGCTLQRMTPAEVLKGATQVAARAIGLADQAGTLEAGRQADFVLIDAPSVEQWLYHFRREAVGGVVLGGRWVS